jgi:hypothetical protein
MMFHPDDPRYRQLSASEEAEMWAQHAEAAAFAAECAREEEEREMERLAAGIEARAYADRVLADSEPEVPASERVWRVVV